MKALVTPWAHRNADSGEIFIDGDHEVAFRGMV